MLQKLQGKKTIICGLLMVVAAVISTAAGVTPPTSALAIVGLGAAIAGFADKANRHQAELIAALGAVARAGGDYRSGDQSAAVRELIGLAAGAIVPAPSAPIVGGDQGR